MGEVIWLIGKRIEVVGSRNKSCEGIKGIVFDETKNMLLIETDDGRRKKLIKSQSRFCVDGITIDGPELTGRIEERIKRWTKQKKP